MLPISYIASAMRILIDLPDPQIEALAALCERVRQPRAVIIRKAVVDYLERNAAQPQEAAFGAWGSTAQDGLEYQHSVRAEW